MTGELDRPAHDHPERGPWRPCASDPRPRSRGALAADSRPLGRRYEDMLAAADRPGRDLLQTRRGGGLSRGPRAETGIFRYTCVLRRLAHDANPGGQRRTSCRRPSSRVPEGVRPEGLAGGPPSRGRSGRRRAARRAGRTQGRLPDDVAAAPIGMRRQPPPCWPPPEPRQGVLRNSCDRTLRGIRRDVRVLGNRALAEPEPVRRRPEAPGAVADLSGRPSILTWNSGIPGEHEGRGEKKRPSLVRADSR